MMTTVLSQFFILLILLTSNSHDPPLSQHRNLAPISQATQFFKLTFVSLGGLRSHYSTK